MIRDDQQDRDMQERVLRFRVALANLETADPPELASPMRQAGIDAMRATRRARARTHREDVASLSGARDTPRWRVMAIDEPWNPTPPGWTSTPKPTTRQGEDVWRVTLDGRTIACELHDESRRGAGWDVAIRQDGDLEFRRRCADEAFARFVAKGLLQDHLRAGWTE